MDIGTAKPTPEEQRAVVHHLIDVCEPNEDFDAARFVAAARAAAEDIVARGRLPLLVGGTGLYIKAFLQGIFRVRPVDPALRARLQAEAETLGGAALHRRLAAVDPQTAARLHPNDTFRVIRALETYEATGQPISRHHAAHRFSDCPYRALKIGLRLPREALYRRIEERVDAMLAAGLEAEVRGLLAAGFGPELKPMQAIGYRHVADMLLGRIDRQECVRTLKRDTRRFAKRQMTWFGADPEIRWFAPTDIAGVRQAVAAFLREDAPGG